MSLTGQCLCGIITYELKNPPAMTGVCHCKNCQRQAGSAFSTLAGVAKTDFVLKSGQMKIYKDSETDTGNTVERHFCAECGSPIYSAVPDSPDVLVQQQTRLGWIRRRCSCHAKDGRIRLVDHIRD